MLAAANAVYGVWARYRMEVTGREALSIILERRKLQVWGHARMCGHACIYMVVDRCK